jgi:uncharacterized membrane protein
MERKYFKGVFCMSKNKGSGFKYVIAGLIAFWVSYLVTKKKREKDLEEQTYNTINEAGEVIQKAN